MSNARIIGTVEVVEVSKKRQMARFRWYGHVMSDGGSDEKNSFVNGSAGKKRKTQDKEERLHSNGYKREWTGYLCLGIRVRAPELRLGLRLLFARTKHTSKDK